MRLAFWVCVVLFASPSAAHPALAKLPLRLHSVSDHLFFTTTRLTVNVPGEKDARFGTGFWFRFEGKPFSLLITCKHVLPSNSASAEFYLREWDQAAGEYLLGTEKVVWRPRPNAPARIEHPDQEVDIAALVFGEGFLEVGAPDGKFDPLKPVAIGLFLPETTIATNDLLKEKLTLGVPEQVFMYGYPVGFYDAVNDLPLMRSGVLSSLPFLTANFNGNSSHPLEIAAVDMICLPGSSGSPIFWLETTKNVYPPPPPTVHLLGVATKYLFRKNNVVSAEDIPTKLEDRTTEPNHIKEDIGIGIYWKAVKLLDLREEAELALR